MVSHDARESLGLSVVIVGTLAIVASSVYAVWAIAGLLAAGIAQIAVTAGLLVVLSPFIVTAIGLLARVSVFIFLYEV